MRIFVCSLLMGVGATALAADGKAVYEASCRGCHSSGMPGIPQLGDKAGWADRAATGVDALVRSAIDGVRGKNGGYMPPRGGNARLSDADIRAAVSYMLEAVQ